MKFISLDILYASLLVLCLGLCGGVHGNIVDVVINAFSGFSRQLTTAFPHGESVFRRFIVGPGSFLPWSQWTCSYVSGSCFQNRKRNCSSGNVNDCNGRSSEVKVCTSCPVTTSTTAVSTSRTSGAAWSQWFYGPCSVTCGTGTKQGIRRCSTGTDTDCVGLLYTADTCQEAPCGVWSSWFYGPCTTTCGPGTKQGIRHCSTGHEHECQGSAFQTATCNVLKCPAPKTTKLQSTTAVKTSPVTMTTPTTARPYTWSTWGGWLCETQTSGRCFATRRRNCSTGINTDCTGKHINVHICNMTICAGQCINDPDFVCISDNPDIQQLICDDPSVGKVKCPVKCGYCCEDVVNCSSQGLHDYVCSDDTLARKYCKKSCNKCVTLLVLCLSLCGCVHGNIVDTAINALSTFSRQLTAVLPYGESLYRRFIVGSGGGSWQTWGAWKCDRSQGACVMGRFRNCSTGVEADCHGTPYTVQPCTPTVCDVPHWQDWGGWQCSYFPTGGMMGNIRNCSTGRESDCSGKSNVIQACDSKICPHAEFLPWSAWACSYASGSCFQARKRNCSTGNPRDCYGSHSEITLCTMKCPAPWTEWGAWQCVYSGHFCFGRRQRNCTTGKEDDCDGLPYELKQCGAECITSTVKQAIPTTPTTTTTTTTTPSTTSTTSTTTVATPTTVPTSSTTSGVWSTWFYGPCSVTCGNGTRQGIRRCSSGKDKDCVGSASTTDTCQAAPCGVWSSWFYGPCSATCGPGTKQGIRRCSSGNEHECQGSAFQTTTCEDHACPVDGGWGDWQTWESCSRSCGTGTQRRHRVCNNPMPLHNGKMCPGGPDEYDMKYCSLADCPHWGSYHQVGTCSVTCGDGVIQLQRDCSTGNNHDCTGSPFDEKPCSRPQC